MWASDAAMASAGDRVDAFGFLGRTLCGIQEADMSPSDTLWMPERDNACSACREAAVAIDERRPLAMRGEDARVSVARGPGAR